MKKIIGIILVGILVLNIIGVIYLGITNPGKLGNNSMHFIKKIAGALVIGALGVYLMSKNEKK